MPGVRQGFLLVLHAMTREIARFVVAVGAIATWAVLILLAGCRGGEGLWP